MTAKQSKDKRLKQPKIQSKLPNPKHLSPAQPRWNKD
jgi:hypothetical protein